MKKMKTWSARSNFEYSGTVEGGTVIDYGEHKAGCFSQRTPVTAEHYQNLLRHFRGRIVKVGTSRDKAPPDSLGYWLQDNVIRRALASYVAPILIEECYAERVEKDKASIRFYKKGKLRNRDRWL